MVSTDHIIPPFITHIIRSIINHSVFSAQPLCNIYKKEIVFNKLPNFSNLKNTIINKTILKTILSFTFNLAKRVVNRIK